MPRLKVVLAAADIERISKLVQSRSGIDLQPNRPGYLEIRISERMEALGITEVAEYMERLTLDRGEFNRFIEALVIQETFFFRHSGHFRMLREKVLPAALAEDRVPANRRLRVWSAGCANGPEPYSIAIELLDAIPAARPWPIEVLATDISAKSLEEARAGRFGERMLKHVPAEYLARYFDHASGAPVVSDRVKALVKFQQHNLMQGGYPAEVDAVFCRNVLIYFDEKDREKIVTGFHLSLRRNGFLFLGYSETLRDFPHLFETVEHDGTFAYRKLERRLPIGEPRLKRTTVVLDLLRKSLEAQGAGANAAADSGATGTRSRFGGAAAPTASATAPPAAAGTAAAISSSGQTARRHDDIHVVALQGELDAEAANAGDNPMRTVFQRALQEGPHRILINLDGVTFLDAAGTDLLLRAVNLVKDHGGRVRFVVANPSVRRWLEKPQYSELFEICRSEPEARAAFLRDAPIPVPGAASAPPAPAPAPAPGAAAAEPGDSSSRRDPASPR
ncbi:MAG: STAS domain-containing protein [Planctomycetes bacterium]|nr:STAS domain-containing protein [Planctomycetota bacterium]